MYIIYLIITIVFLLEEYIRLNSRGFTHSVLPETFFIAIYLIASIWYLYKYRKKNLFCFEFLFLLFGFLIIFFNYLILSSVEDSGLAGSLFERFNEDIKSKTLYVSMLATLMFLLGSSVSDWKFSISKKKCNEIVSLSKICNNLNIRNLSKILTITTILYFFYLLAIGNITSWFKYSTESNNYANTKVVYLTTLCLSSTIAQFSQFAGYRYVTWGNFIKRVDKFYLIIIGIVTILLLISGNRNEALFVILPMIVCYSVFVKTISNKDFLLFFIVGYIIMVFIGQTRQTGVTSNLDFDLQFKLFESTQDFAFANIDSMFLIEMTDKSGATGFNMGIITLLSSIPFVGGIMLDLFPIEEFTRSALAATEGMGISYTGLGTSLVGDTYSAGGIIFTLVYFYFLGRVMSYLHNQNFNQKIINIYTLVMYAFMLSNAIYCLRSEWYSSFRYIGFSMFLLFMFGLFNRLSRNEKIIVRASRV